MSREAPGEVVVQAVRRHLRLPSAPDEPHAREVVGELLTALARFAELLPAAERPGEALELLADVASTNAFEPLRIERRLPITVVFYAHVHPGYYEGDSRIGEAAWRLCYTDGGAVGPSPVRRRLAEAMHDKNPFGEVPFDGGKTVLVQEGTRFQAVTALYGAIGMPLFILAKGGVRYYASGAVDATQKQDAVCRWAASSWSAPT